MKVKSYMRYAPHQELTLVGGWYANKRMAIRALNSEGEPVATLTVNIPERPLDSSTVFIKDWNANEGALETLLKAGLIEPTNSFQSGFVTVHRCKWLGGEL